MKSKALAIKAYYWCYIHWLAFLWCFQTNLGNEVIYAGQRHRVINGVQPLSWTLIRDDDGRRIEAAPRDQCRLILTPKNILHSFRSGRRFYFTSWYSIWIREGIKPWMRHCNIWPRALRFIAAMRSGVRPA